MKTLALSLLLLLGGCSTSAWNFGDKDFGDLETAPKNDSEVMHPDWGDASQAPVASVHKWQASSPAQSLEQYLRVNGFAYDRLPGSGEALRLQETVKFATGSARLSEHSKRWLVVLARYLSAQQGINVVIDGHTDSTGSASLNQTLSEKRARAVKAELVKYGVFAPSIYTLGHGEMQPQCTNNSSSGRACNRRSELRFVLSAR